MTHRGEITDDAWKKWLLTPIDPAKQGGGYLNAHIGGYSRSDLLAMTQDERVRTIEEAYFDKIHASDWWQCRWPMRQETPIGDVWVPCRRNWRGRVANETYFCDGEDVYFCNRHEGVPESWVANVLQKKPGIEFGYHLLDVLTKRLADGSGFPDHPAEIQIKDFVSALIARLQGDGLFSDVADQLIAARLGGAA